MDGENNGSKPYSNGWFGGGSHYFLETPSNSNSHHQFYYISLTMVINHLLTGMILQVGVVPNHIFKKRRPGTCAQAFKFSVLATV